jgi:hypothetical protein
MRAVRALAPALAAAFGACVALLALGGLTPAFTDYEVEAEPAVRFLVAGDLAGFAGAMPMYGGSLLLRSPAALLVHALGGGDLAVFRALAAPCVAAAAAFAVFEVRRLHEAGRPWLDRALLFGLLAFNPLTIRALDVGHPEELLTGVLCVAAVLCALGGRPWLAMTVLGVAIGCKPWAIVAVGPTLLALDHGRLKAAAVALGVAVLVAAPVLLGAGAVRESLGVLAEGGPIFQPWQLFWFLGDPDVVVTNFNGVVKEGYRAAPGWALGGTKLHLLAVVAAITALASWRGVRGDRALALLAALLLLRCLLDTWNTDYYALPFLMALAAWEVRARSGPPLATLVATAAAYATTWLLQPVASPDTLAALYLAWAIPFAGWLLAGAFGMRLPMRRLRPAPA